MNFPFLAFIVILVGLIAWMCWLFWDALNNVANAAAEHAKLHTISYIKGAALIAIGVGASFEAEFKDLSVDQSIAMAWWAWSIKFWKPIAAGLAVLIAFLDRSFSKPNDEKPKPQPPPPTPNP